MSRIRMNTELRTKILNRYRDHAEKKSRKNLMTLMAQEKKWI